MAFVHQQSCECTNSELDLFSVPTTQTSIENAQWIEHRPVASIGAGGPIEFVIPGSGDDYLDVANTYLFVKAKVNQANGSNIDVAAKVGPVNNWMHSLFSQVDVSLNGTLVTPSTNTYPYRAYIETLLSHGAEAKNSQLTSVLWHKDTAGQMDATDTGKAGLQKRQDYNTGSRVIDMMGRLLVDLFFQDRYLLNGVDVKVRMVQSKDRFALMTDGNAPDYKITIVEAALYGRKAKFRADGTHQSPQERYGKIPDASCWLQGIFHTKRIHVAYTREYLPRSAAEKSGLVLYRQRRVQRCAQQKSILC